MSTPRHAGPRRNLPYLAAAGLVALGLAAAGSVLAVNPAHGATAPTRLEAPLLSVVTNAPVSHLPHRAAQR